MKRTMLMHNGNSSETFGWLLKDVPHNYKYSQTPTDNQFVNHSFKEEKECRKLQATRLLQLDLSKTVSPRRRCRCNTYNSLISSSTWPSPRLSHVIELDDNEGIEEPRYQFFKMATVLDNRLEDISFQTIKLQKQTKTLKQAYEELDGTITQLLTDVHCLIAELQYLRNLEDLIKLLDDKTENISSQKWPFVMAHSSPLSDLNLII